MPRPLLRLLTHTTTIVATSSCRPSGSNPGPPDASLVTLRTPIDDARADVTTAGVEPDPDWCFDPVTHSASDRVVPPFTMSAAHAVGAALGSKHMEIVRKRVPEVAIDSMGFQCARVCPVPDRSCGFHFRSSDLKTKSPSSLVEWLYLDPMTKTLWWEERSLPDGGVIWGSERVR
jgi:hypothetical protein